MMCVYGTHHRQRALLNCRIQYVNHTDFAGEVKYQINLFPRSTLHLKCAALMFPFRFPPREYGIIWSAVARNGSSKCFGEAIGSLHKWHLLR